MAETLFITPSQMAATTIMGGNVDPDKYLVNIAFVQLNTIEPLLGSELYDKISSEFIADTLAGLYETLFDEFVFPITKHEALAQYIEVSNFMLDNGGLFQHTAENRQLPTKDDSQFVAGKYHAMAEMYIKRFEKWICKNGSNIPEYKKWQDEVNAQNVKTTSGWYFGRHQNGHNSYEINECDL